MYYICYNYTEIFKNIELEAIKISDFDKIDYWLESADYDFETAKAMLKSKRFLYVGYMCNQVIEKMLKAYYVKAKGKQPPYTHKLIRLAEESNIYKKFDDEQKDFLDMISPLNIEARYPTQKQILFESLNKAKCTEIIKRTEELVSWIKSKLEN